MKLIIILLTLTLFPILILPSNAQTSDTLIFVKHILRDSDGNLVASFEITKIEYIQESDLATFLDLESNQNDPILMIGNQKMQIIERQGSLYFDSNNAIISDTTLNTFNDGGETTILIKLIHDGIPVVAGDELITIWTFIRPVQ